MLIVYDTLNKGEYPYINGTFTFGDYGSTLKPFRGFLLKGKNFDVYKANKVDLRESILSRVHKEDENPAPLVVTTELGINDDYVGEGLLVLFTTDGAMMVTPIEENYKLFFRIGEETFVIDEDGLRLAQGDEELSTVHWFTVDQLKQGINANAKLANAISRNKDWEEYFTFKLHITPEGNVVVRTVHNFMGGIMVDGNGQPQIEVTWDWYVLTEDGRRRRLKSGFGQYHPNDEQIEGLISESDFSVVEAALKEYEIDYKAHIDAINKEVEVREEGSKSAKAKKAKAKAKGARGERSGGAKGERGNSSDGHTKVSRDAAASFLAAVNAIATEGQEE